MSQTNHAKWDKLEGWLEVDIWAPITAAYILADLDPDETYGPCEQGFDPVWLTHCRPDGLPSDPYSRFKNIEMSIQHSIWLTNYADFVEVQTPHEWLRWSVKARLEPAWLRPANGVKHLRALLPLDLAPFRDAPTPPETIRDVARLGGTIKAARSPAGKAKRRLIPFIETRLKEGLVENVAAFVDECLASIQPHEREHAKRETIQKWISQVRKRMK